MLRPHHVGLTVIAGVVLGLVPDRPWGARSLAAPPGGVVAGTHSQEQIIRVVGGGGPDEKLTTFAVDADGRVLAGVAGEKSLLRVYDGRGEQVAEWPLPVPPEAVNVDPQGDILVAGQGEMLKLDGTGKIILQREAPNMAGAAEAARGVQRRVRDQAGRDLTAKQRALVQSFRKQLADTERKLADIDRDLVELDKRELAGEDTAEGDTIAAARATLQKRRELYEKKQAKLESNIRNPPSPKPTGSARQAAPLRPMPEPAVEVRQLVAAQMKIAAISASKTDIFFTCNSSTGTGFDVWRTDHQFDNGRKVGESLRGCCGQLDVQANDHAVYVAENTRHRVRGFSRDGRPLVEFGSSARGQDDAFEGCCNPMNVAFGDDGSVYTSESGSGRIKRFTAAGRFIEVVGQVELVPGCKKVSIAVSPSGDQVYMLDITRGHIVVMRRTSPRTAGAGEQAVVPAALRLASEAD